MTPLRRAAIVLLALLAAPAGAALPPAMPVIERDPARLAVSGADHQLVPVTGQPFAQAIRVAVKQRQANVWNAQLRAPITAPVKRGDVLLMTFWMRAVSTGAEAGEVAANAIFERSSPPHNKALQIRCAAGREW